MAGLMNIGFGNVVNTDKIITIISPDSAPAKRMVQRAKEDDRIVDATQGRRTKSVILTESSHIILSALQPGYPGRQISGKRFNGRREII